MENRKPTYSNSVTIPNCMKFGSMEAFERARTFAQEKIKEKEEILNEKRMGFDSIFFVRELDKKLILCMILTRILFNGKIDLINTDQYNNIPGFNLTWGEENTVIVNVY